MRIYLEARDKREWETTWTREKLPSWQEKPREIFPTLAQGTTYKESDISP